MFLGFLDTHTALTFLHIVGAVLGAGGAYASDLIFFSSVKDGKISPTEFRFMRLGSFMVWTGLVILILSGAGLFALDPEKYLASSKFLAKVTIVGIIFANGVFFHISHIPRFHRHIGGHLPSSDEFVRKGGLLLASGAISFISWTSALLLGVVRSIPYSYFEIMTVYFLVIALGIFVANFARKKLFSF